jgi:twitching motility protein PilJ
MDEPMNKLDIASLKESPRRQQSGPSNVILVPNELDRNQSPHHQQNGPRQEAQATNVRDTQTGMIESARRSSTRSEAAGFQDVPVGQKLALIALALALPIALLLFFVTQRDNANANFAIKEQRGVEYLQSLVKLFEVLPDHLASSVAVLSGNAGAEQARLEAANIVDETLSQIEAVNAKYGAEFRTSALLASLKTKWTAIKTQHNLLNPQLTIERHTALINNDIVALIKSVADYSNLILDPDLDSYYLMSLATQDLPRAINASGVLRTLAITAATQGSISPEAKVALQAAFDRAVDELKVVSTNINSSFSANPVVKQRLDSDLFTMNTELSKVVRNVYGNILGSANLNVSGERMLEISQSSYRAQFTFYYTVLRELDALLQKRIAGIRQNLLYTLLGIAGALLIAFALIAFITRQITGPLRELGRVSELLGRGDLSQVANIDSRDEIGTLAKSFNTSILQLREASERQELEIARGKQLQNNIGDFLNVAMDIAQGDFTRRGQVSEDALGNVVDAINFMTEELGYVLKDVQSATDSVTQGATDMFGTSDEIARSAERQANEAQKARYEVQVVTASIRQMATTAGSSAQAAQRTLAASQEGRQAVSATLTEMQNIRREVQTVAKRVKGLSERSLEISEIVETISKIAKQTNLLALNAALEASAAGDAGARFATVAAEVRSLAENTTGAVQRVSGLIKSVQDEVQEVLAGVETGNRQVEGGYRVAQQAGERLEEIATIAQQTAQFAQEISSVTREQVGRVEQVGQVVEQMANISEQSQETVSQGREAAQRLQALASQLSSSIARFRIA